MEYHSATKNEHSSATGNNMDYFHKELRKEASHKRVHTTYVLSTEELKNELFHFYHLCNSSV